MDDILVQPVRTFDMLLGWQLACYVTTTGLLRHDNWLATSPNIKPDNKHHLGPEFRPEMSTKHVRVYVRVCMHRKFLEAWPGRHHGDGVTLIIIVERSFTMTVHAQIWPVLRDYIHEQ
jgi:hypothetical protein